MTIKWDSSHYPIEYGVYSEIYREKYVIYVYTSLHPIYIIGLTVNGSAYIYLFSSTCSLTMDLSNGGITEKDVMECVVSNLCSDLSNNFYTKFLPSQNITHEHFVGYNRKDKTSIDYTLEYTCIFLC